jgi:hypothetical protein
MKASQSQSRIGNAILVLSLVFGVGIALSTTVRAHNPNDRNAQDGQDRNRGQNRNDNDGQTRRGRNWDRYGNYGGSFELRQTALNTGYNEGIKEGRSDRNRRNPSDYRNRSAYQKATKDYSSKLGDRELYRRYYREGFENGYTDGRNGG